MKDFVGAILNNLPLVSIIIPCYNREKYISQAIDSVLNQTYQPIEVIVVDDGSQDNSINVVKKYGNRISLIEQANRGVSAARNTGFKAAQGSYIIFLDSDDWLSNNIVESHIQTLNKWPEVDICCTDSVSAKNENTLSNIIKSAWPDTPGTPVELFLLSPPPFPACEIYKASTVKRLGGYDEEMRAFADSNLRLRIIIGGGKVVRTDGSYAVYRPVENSITKNTLKLHFFALKLIKKLSSEVPYNNAKIHLLLKERTIRHRLRIWYNVLNYHLSLKPTSVLKLFWHFVKISKVDPGYILFIIKDKPWKRSRTDMF